MQLFDARRTERLFAQYVGETFTLRRFEDSAFRYPLVDEQALLFILQLGNLRLFAGLRLLELLLRNAGRVMTRGQLIDRIWGADYVGDTKTLDVHVKRLRSKIEPDPARPVKLVTVRGLGYLFTERCR